MRCLEEIIIRNAEAAGREAAHADNDGNDRKSSAIVAAQLDLKKNPEQHNAAAFGRGYLLGVSEG